jgi:hypothetical protein
MRAFALLLLAVAITGQKIKSEWYTKQDKDGYWKMYNDALGSEAAQLKGVSMTGFETGTRGTQSGGGYWLFDPVSPSAQTTLTIVQNIMKVLTQDWHATLIRIPVCGSAWLQNYNVQDWSKNIIANYKTWVDNAVTPATQNGATVILDLHLWAIAPETNKTRNSGLEDGCTGINKVCVGVPSCIDSCAPHDWYGQYTSARTGKTYNSGDDVNNWQCSIANADGCTLDNIKRGNNTEHFLNFWYDAANHYKSNTNVFFELFNEPYQRKSANFNDPACVELEQGTSFMCPPGTGFGDNLDESQYDWTFWSSLMDQAITVIRDTGATNMILVTGLDWNYDYLGAGGSSTGGPIARPSLLPWYSRGVKNVGYSLHPYQHGACCGAIGSSSDLSINDPYQSAFCQYAPANYKASNSPLPIPDSVSAGSKQCDSTGYATTQDKKAPPCIWAQAANLCAGDKAKCQGKSQSNCSATDWSSDQAGGWSTYVLPMAKYGPLFATEFGPFDCSSPFTTAFLKWAKQFSVGYTAWALWPQNSGGPGSGACGYPSVIVPTGGPLDASCAFGKCSPNCDTTVSACSSIIQPMGWSGKLVYADIHG